MKIFYTQIVLEGCRKNKIRGSKNEVRIPEDIAQGSYDIDIHLRRSLTLDTGGT